MKFASVYIIQWVSMSKVFLSHSGQDKEWYVEPVYRKLIKKLGKDSVIIDNVTFEEGRNITNEIDYHIKKADLFVFFISNKSLKSGWVEFELGCLKKNIDNGMEYQICPIIIDDIVNYKDERIPEWLEKNYSIKRICSTTKAAKIIQQRMFEISYEKHPNLKQRHLLFVGRNDYIQKFEERMDNFEISKPIAVIASGLDGIGRRTCLKHGLYKSNIVKDTYQFSSIVLGMEESIEDCILKLYNLGLITDLDVKIEQLSKMNKEEKIELLRKIIVLIQNMNEIVIIIDNGGIVGHDGVIVNWFLEVIKKESLEKTITFLIISKFRYFSRFQFEDVIYHVALQELNKKERNGLLNRYLDIKKISLCTEEKKIISDNLTGFPGQIFYAVDLLADCGWDNFFNDIDVMIAYNNGKATVILQEFKDDTEMMEFISLLSSFDYIPIQYVLEIVEDREMYIEYIDRLFCRGICEYVGIGTEYIRVNDTIKDYIRRQKIVLSNKHEIRLNQKACELLHNIDENDYDVPELLHSLKLCVESGKEIDSKYVIPSIYLKIMSDLYYLGKNEDVVRFADRALENMEVMDDKIIFEIRYLLCSALAKLRSDRFKKEVMKIIGADHNFLFGFYYRQVGRFDKALESINKSLELRPKFSKAKREKVQIYIGMQDYESAIELARENYQNYRDNPYHIQAYFTCLIKSENIDNREETLNNLIHDMECIGSNLSEELTLRFRGQYAAFIEGNRKDAMDYINKAIATNKNIHYARLVQFDIAERFNDLETMKDVIKFFKNGELAKRYNDSIVCMEARCKAKRGEVQQAEKYFKEHIKNYTESAKERFICRLNKQ